MTHMDLVVTAVNAAVVGAVGLALTPRAGNA
jgi:hypothetical protein